MDLKPKIGLVLGTRPDIIKMWPVYQALKLQDVTYPLIIHSNQHNELATQALKTFELKPDYKVSISLKEKTSLSTLTSSLIRKLSKVFTEVSPDLILVHGDTTTAFSAAVAAFLNNIPIGHVEAGLRTSRFEYPFPEEGFRRAISKFTKFHFAPTSKSYTNLQNEGINHNVFITGNTIVDTLSAISPSMGMIVHNFPIRDKVILVTCHRRESWDDTLINLCKAIIQITTWKDDRTVIWPVHSNPKVNDVVKSQLWPLENDTKVVLHEPMDYQTFIAVLYRADLVITDSGGVMEEAAVLGKPTLVLRTETERPEILDLDNIQLVGYDFDELVKLTNEWLNNPPQSNPSQVFGDGTAGIQIGEIISSYFHHQVSDENIM